MKNTSVLLKYFTILLLFAWLPGCVGTLGTMLQPTSTPPSQDSGTEPTLPPENAASSQEPSSSQDKASGKKMYKIIIKRDAMGKNGEMKSSSAGNVGMSWGDRLKLNGLNLAFDSMGLGWKATIDDTGAFKAAGHFNSLPIEIFFNAGSGQIVGITGLRLADVDIPLSKEGVMPALNDNIMRLLQKKGVSEQTAHTLSTGLQPILSAIQKVF